MYCITQFKMKNFLWIGWLYQTLLKEVLSYPINPFNSSIVNESRLCSSGFGLQYALSTILVIVMVTALLGCLCCRRTKGFQDAKGNKQQEFKDGSIARIDTVVERDLELDISRPSLNQLQFEALTVECFVLESKTGPGTPKPPASSHINNRNQETNQDFLSLGEEWLSPALHISRERLKYFREIGRGWFGKVVEGIQDLNATDVILKTNGVVVRILTEEASVSERAWFLGEALPYLKLDHPNILKLLGVCLETDPYLLLFESCVAGDLKAFLKANRASMDTLTRENILLKMAIDLATGLEHMHLNGFSHTDLSARNCLVASDLSFKLGDYGIGVEKYPMEYYVVGDRALPIRWSAPESLVCTDTTIETRAITPKANLWSFAILLWEIGSWGERPYDYFGDDQVIEMILSRTYYDHLPLKCLQKRSEHFLDAIKSCWKLEANERATIPDIISILKGNKSDFDQRWDSLQPNSKEPMRSLSLKELRGNIDSDLWKADEIMFSTPQARFKLGPGEPVKSTFINKTTDFAIESGSETEEESWRGRVERGVYTEKVKQKSKSVADLMILVHIDSDSEAEWSLSSQAIEKPKKRISSGSVGDLRTTVLTDEFDEALKKLRNPSSTMKVLKESVEKTEKVIRKHENILDFTSTPKNDSSAVSSGFVDVELWKNALEFELERKISKCDLESINFDKLIDIHKCESNLKQNSIVLSAPDTPQSRLEDLSVDNEDFSNSEEVETEKRKFSHGDDEEDRKHLSTPDDERSSDSGFRDKESCEEEENPCIHSLPGPLSYGVFPTTPIPISASVEEEQLKVLLELDTILDAEDSRSLDDTFNLPLSPNKMNLENMENDIHMQPLKLQFEEYVTKISEVALEHEQTEEEKKSKLVFNAVKIEKENKENLKNVLSLDMLNNDTLIELNKDEENDDEDSSTMSLRSDNSYVSFNLDEEFVTAIRNELREKLPNAQMSVVESQELRDGEESTLNSIENETKTWGDDEETLEREGSNVDIAIRYNFYGIPLSPILEERESNLNSESLGDASVASKISGSSEDILLVDVRTNQVVMVESTAENDEDDHDTSNGDITDDDSLSPEPLNVVQTYSEIQGKSIGAPMPSPEEESKWQAQLPIPLQLQDDLMSASFSTSQDWDSQDEDDVENDEDDSSSSEEFIWKRYEEITTSKNQDRNNLVYFTPTVENIEQKTEENNKIKEDDVEEEGEEDEEDEEDDEEFTPSAWDANLAPHRSALRSPEKTLRTGKLCFHSCCQDKLDQKKNVWFKKQRYHCVYEYPKETPAVDCQAQPTTTWEPTTYSAWEEMIEKPNTEVYTIDYEESSHNNEEFFVSSGNRPFQFQVGDGRYVSQFFPGASAVPFLNDQPIEIFNMVEKSNKSSKTDPGDNYPSQQQTQLGELRHTRNRLKLDLSIKGNNSNNPTSINALNINKSEEEDQENNESDSKTEKTETSTESPTTKDELSIISIIRSPMESLSEKINQRDLKCITNGESDEEISELEMSFHEEKITKTSHRPLFLIKQDSSEQGNEAIDKSNETLIFVKTEPETNKKIEQIIITEQKENNTSTEDGTVIKSLDIDFTTKSNEVDCEYSKNFVHEST